MLAVLLAMEAIWSLQHGATDDRGMVAVLLDMSGIVRKKEKETVFSFSFYFFPLFADSLSNRFQIKGMILIYANPKISSISNMLPESF